MEFNPLEAHTVAVQSLMGMAKDEEKDPIVRIRACELLLIYTANPPVPFHNFPSDVECPNCGEDCTSDEDGNAYCEDCKLVIPHDTDLGD